MDITALPINCSLKPSGGKRSSTDAMIAVLAEHFANVGVTVSDTVRVADLNVMPGVSNDEGKGDDWPKLRTRILAHDILIFGGPIWMGQISSVAKRVLERMDAFLSDTDALGHMPSYGKVAVAAIVGNEDGAHFSTAQLLQSLNDTGWTTAPVAACYWVGEAMGSMDFVDLEQRPAKVEETAKMATANAAHLARLLKANPYP